MNTIKVFILCNKNIQILLVLRTCENTNVFITLDENIYDIHNKRVNILYLFFTEPKSIYPWAHSWVS